MIKHFGTTPLCNPRLVFVLLLLASFLCPKLSYGVENEYENNLSTANVAVITGTLIYGDDLDVLLGYGTKSKEASCSFIFSPPNNLIIINIYDGNDNRLMSMEGKVSNMKQNISDEGYFQGFTIDAQGEKYRIFRASELAGVEVRVGDKDQISYIFDMGCTYLYNSDDLSKPLESGCDNYWDEYGASGLINDWFGYIRTYITR